MNIGQGMVVRAVAFGAALSLSLVGIGFLAFGMFSALLPICGATGAAFITAFACMSIAALVVIAVVSRAPQVHAVAPPSAAVPATNNDHIINALSELAHEHPLMAVCCAAVLGATGGGTKPR
jgi:hypothetical protein